MFKLLSKHCIRSIQLLLYGILIRNHYFQKLSFTNNISNKFSTDISVEVNVRIWIKNKIWFLDYGENGFYILKKSVSAIYKNKLSQYQFINCRITQKNYRLSTFKFKLIDVIELTIAHDCYETVNWKPYFCYFLNPPKYV